MPSYTTRQAEETKMISAWFSEAALEVAAAGGPPLPVEAAMRARVDESFNTLAYRIGVPHAVAMLAAVAFAAGRKAERAGLVHETPAEAEEEKR